MTTAGEMNDPVDPRQRRQARLLGLAVAGVFFALVAVCFVVFSRSGLPKDPKEWKRLQERRSAAEAEKAAQATDPAATPVPLSEPKSEKDQTR